MSSILVDTLEAVQAFIEEIEQSPLQRPFLFIDFEGTNLSRNGSIAIMQVLVPPKRVVHLIDISTLGKAAFQFRSASGNTLKDVLESEEFAKVFFDVRHDSDALYAHYSVILQSVVDIQLLEFATRSGRGRYLNGLARCIMDDSPLTFDECCKWQNVKDAGIQLFAPEKGGSYDVFHQRPLLPAIIDYCAQDVLLLPALLIYYAGRLSKDLAYQVQRKTIDRVENSQSPEFEGNGRHMTIGPPFTDTYFTQELEYPMSVIMSSGLASYCALDAPLEATRNAEGPNQGQRGTITDESSDSSTGTSQRNSASTIATVVESLASSQVDTPRRTYASVVAMQEKKNDDPDIVTPQRSPAFTTTSVVDPLAALQTGTVPRRTYASVVAS